MHSKAIRNEKGVALILIAVSIVVLFGFGALAIDVGHLYNVKSQLQAAADAAALAGAGEMTGSTLADMANSAYTAADRVAMHNFADVAAVDTPHAAEGDQIPVSLTGPNTGNSSNGDVVLGRWSGDTWTDTSDPALINAVKVVARRTNDNPASAQPKANNWFAKVFSLLPLGPMFDFTAIQATAIAAKEGNPLPVMPIVVNEYWYEEDGEPYGTANQNYPNSFVRSVNVDGNPSKVFRNTFAIFGAAAEPNAGSNDLDGYVNLNERWTDYLSNVGPYHAVDVANPSCSTCGSAVISGADPGGKKFDDSLPGEPLWNLNNGYPITRILPTAIMEPLNTPSGYPATQPPKYTTNSECPYATLSYIPNGGKPALNKIITSKYRKGSQFIALVYDGTHGGTGQGVTTIVGYVKIEIDGFYNGGNPPKKNGGFYTYTADPTYAHNRSILDDTPGNTMYGHAVADIIAPDETTSGKCGFLQQLQSQLQDKTTVRLVGPGGNQHYGLLQSH